MRIGRIGTVFGSSWNPYTDAVGKVNRVERRPEEGKENGKEEKPAKNAERRDEYIPSNPDGRVTRMDNNYNGLGYLMKQAENSARFDNFNTEE